MRLIAFLSFLPAFIFAFDLPEVKANPLQKEIIDTALSMIGGTYEWGAYDPKNRRFDCWNFVTWVFHHVLDRDGGVKHMLIGIDDPLWVFFDDLRDIRPADVLMNGGEHTVGFHAGIYYGEGFTIEARGKDYGIGIFRIEGKNPRCPFGETGYRFCFYSLLTRLWLDPRPDFPYAYLKYYGTFFFSDEGIPVEVHVYSPRSGEFDLLLEVVDYVTGKVLRRFERRVELEGGKELVLHERLDVDGISGYVYLSVEMFFEGKKLFHYDTYVRKHIEIIE